MLSIIRSVRPSRIQEFIQRNRSASLKFRASESLRDYYAYNGAVGNSVLELEKSFLSIRGYSTLDSFLSAKGYSGTTEEMLQSFMDDLDSLLINGGFEVGTGTTNANFNVLGWTQGSPGNATVISIDSTQPHTGSKALKIAVDATNSLNGVSSSVVAVKPSTQYTLTIYAKSGVAGQLQVQLREDKALGRCLQTDGTTWSAFAAYYAVDTTTSYGVTTITFTTASDQTTLCISDLKRSGASTQANKTFYVDRIVLTKG